MRIRMGNASVSVYRVKHMRMPSGCQFVVAWSSPSGRQRKTLNDELRAVVEDRAVAQQLNSFRNAAFPPPSPFGLLSTPESCAISVAKHPTKRHKNPPDATLSLCHFLCPSDLVGAGSLCSSTRTDWPIRRRWQRLASYWFRIGRGRLRG